MGTTRCGDNRDDRFDRVAVCVVAEVGKGRDGFNVDVDVDFDVDVDVDVNGDVDADVDVDVEDDLSGEVGKGLMEA